MQMCVGKGAAGTSDLFDQNCQKSISVHDTLCLIQGFQNGRERKEYSSVQLPEAFNNLKSLDVCAWCSRVCWYVVW